MKVFIPSFTLAIFDLALCLLTGSRFSGAKTDKPRPTADQAYPDSKIPLAQILVIHICEF